MSSNLVHFCITLEGRHYGNVLVHCHRGVSRSASFVIGYLMKKNEFSIDEALSYVQSLRPIVQPNSAFIEQLRKYNPHPNVQDGVTEETVHSSALIGVSFPPATSSPVDLELMPEIQQASASISVEQTSTAAIEKSSKDTDLSNRVICSNDDNSQVSIGVKRARED